jgi:multiple sugar transport system permease protein
MAMQSARGAPTTTGAETRRGARFWTISKRLLGPDWPVAIVFAAPLVLLLFGLIGIPMIRAVFLSFYRVVGVNNNGFAGVENYQRLWSDDQFRGAVVNTIKFAVISVFIKFWVGLVAALMLHNIKRFRSVFTGLVLLPWIVPEVVAALTWRGLYDPVFGGLNTLLLSLGLIDKGISWLGDFSLALPAVIAVNVWKGIPFFTLTLLSGLKAIDGEQYDAAAVDGANAWQRFLNITLPGLRYVIIVAALLSLIFTLNAFGLVFLLTGGGPGGATRLFSILAYEIFNERRYSLATAVAMAIVPGLLILIVILGRYMRGDPSQLQARETSLARIGNWALLALVATVSLIMLVSMVHPIWVLPVLLVAIAAVAYLARGDGLGIQTGTRVAEWLRWSAVLLGVSALGMLVFGLPFVVAALVLFAIVRSEVIDRAFGGRGLVRRASATALDAEAYGRKLGRVRLMGRLGRVGIWTGLGALLLFELFPFYWVIVTSLKTDAQIREFRSVFWPEPFSLENFRYMLQETQFLHWFWNSTQVALVSCLVSVIVGALGAYSLVRLKWRFAAFLSTAILFTYLLPSIIIFIPLYQIFTNLHLINTLQVLMLAYPTFGLPFACWLLMGYYRSIPPELEEAALIDGCNHFQAFFRVILPLTLPALLTVALFALTGAFNDFLFAYVFVRPESLATVSVGLGKMVIGDIFPFGRMMAASIMMAVPVAAVYMLAQRFMVEGLTAGSVKG